MIKTRELVGRCGWVGFGGLVGREGLTNNNIIYFTPLLSLRGRMLSGMMLIRIIMILLIRFCSQYTIFAPSLGFCKFWDVLIILRLRIILFFTRLLLSDLHPHPKVKESEGIGQVASSLSVSLSGIDKYLLW